MKLGFWRQSKSSRGNIGIVLFHRSIRTILFGCLGCLHTKLVQAWATKTPQNLAIPRGRMKVKIGRLRLESENENESDTNEMTKTAYCNNRVEGEQPARTVGGRTLR